VVSLQFRVYDPRGQQGKRPRHGIELLPIGTVAAIAAQQPFPPQLRHLPPQPFEHLVVPGDAVVGIMTPQLLVDGTIAEYRSKARFRWMVSPFRAGWSRQVSIETFGRSSVLHSPFGFWFFLTSAFPVSQGFGWRQQRLSSQTRSGASIRLQNTDSKLPSQFRLGAGSGSRAATCSPSW